MTKTAQVEGTFLMSDYNGCLRSRIRQARRDIVPDVRRCSNEVISDHVLSSPLFQNARRITAYLPFDGEFDPCSVVESAWQMGKEVYLPVLVNKQMQFVFYGPETVLVRHRFGMLEPEHRQHVCLPENLDLVLMPLVAFDVRGNRMGMGGGYYDRTFAFCRQSARKKPRLLGVAYEVQKVPELEAASWDVPMDAVATEKDIYHFHSQVT